jgi:hypothetical protein
MMIEIDCEVENPTPYPLRCLYARVLELAFYDLERNGKFDFKPDFSETYKIVKAAQSRRMTEDWFFRNGYQPESITVQQACDALGISVSAVRRKAREIIKRNREEV